VLNSGRSVGDEPSGMSQLVRLAVRCVATESMERTLSQGQPSDAALVAAQRALQQEASEPLRPIFMRGERAHFHGFMELLEAGEIDIHSWGMLWDTYLRSQAVLLCATAGLAAERYRQANGRWPARLGDLVPGQLSEVPADPYGGGPLRCRQREGTFVVYSVGE